MIWNTQAECMNSRSREAHQLACLKNALQYAYDSVPFYKKKFDDAGISPRQCSSLSDLANYPFTDKEDFRANYPFGLFAVPREKIVRIHASSGTTGKPKVVGYTHKDLQDWSEMCARMQVAAGIRPGDVVQMAFSYGLFTGGFGQHYGLERLGCTVVPAAAGNTARHLMLMEDFQTRVFISTISYGLYLAEAITEQNLLPRLNLKYALFGGEPITEWMRETIQSKLHITATDNYGLSEVYGPGVSYECLEQNGLHINEDFVYAEVINPDTGAPVAEGEEGELVLTTLVKEGMPIIRYRTHDLTVLTDEPCKCGRTSRRMRNVRNRTDDMIIVRGVNVYPSQVESVLAKFDGLAPHYQIIVHEEAARKDLEVKVEMKEEMFSDEMKELSKQKDTIKHNIESVLGFHVQLSLVEPRTIQRTEGKSKRVIIQRSES